MPLYEHVFLARQDVSQQQVETMTKEYTDVITELGGKVTKTEYWGLKSLAYKIKKSPQGPLFAASNIDAPSSAVVEMERRMGLSTDVLRFMTVRVEEHEPSPPSMMRKSDRDDRPERGPGDRGGFRGGDRGGDRGGFRGGDRAGGGGFGGPRPEGGSTFRARPPREGGDSRPPREGGDARGPRGPRPPRDVKPGSEV